jgi:holo-ACP synthase
LRETNLLSVPRDAVSTASLGHVLAARDKRAAFQKMLLSAYGHPVLSLTLVSPGPVKDSPGRRVLMDMAENAFADAVHQAGFTVRQHSRTDGIAGPEALWVVDAQPDRLKRLAMDIEDSRPWGRLLDADVLLAGNRQEPEPLGRQALGCEPRRCLLCGAQARECIGARRHHPATLAAMAAGLVGRFTGLP